MVFPNFPQGIKFSLVLIFLLSQAIEGRTQGPVDFKLPHHVIPISYQIELISVLDEIPQYERFTAPGKVWIQVNCSEATNSITLHALDLKINEPGIYVRDSQGAALDIVRFENRTEFQFFIIHLVAPLRVGERYEIFIPYTAPISATRLDGIYLDSYLDPANNETKYVSTTLFAATHARRAFPCFDDPDLKAVFNVRLGHPPKYHALSNADRLQSQSLPEVPGWNLTSFGPSPLMSTYLVCMIVSDLTYEEVMSSDPEPIRHRVYAPYYFIQRGGGAYSANLSASVNSFFLSYFDTIYPLRKLDNVALPQFYFSAMENYALMTYADRVLLYFEGETSAIQRYQLSLTLSHEVSHNFFGNLVTCRWWTWIWLNEGWATWASHHGLNNTYPELKPWEMFIPNIYQVAMTMDESLATHPVASEPTTLSAVNGIYDDIVYEKAAALIRMMQDFVSEAVLQTAVQRYLKAFQFSGAEQDDLFRIIQEVLDESSGSPSLPGTVKEIMDTWTLQAGYPLLSVQRFSDSQILIRQNQFVQNGVTAGNETWFVPLKLQVLTGPNPRTEVFWIRENETEVRVQVADNEFFFLNPQSIGYFRVQYGAKVLAQFREILEEDHESLAATARAKLLDDAFALAFSGKIPLEQVLDLTLYLGKETDFLVWTTLEKSLMKLGNALRGSEAGAMFANYVVSKIEEASETLDKSGNPDPVDLDYLNHSWDKLRSMFGPGEKVVMDKFGNPLNYHLGREQERRISTLQGLKKETRGRGTRDLSHVTNTVTGLCRMGNSQQDLDEIAEFVEMLSPFELPIHKRKLLLCLEEIASNIEIKMTLAKRVHAWLTKLY